MSKRFFKNKQNKKKVVVESEKRRKQRTLCQLRAQNFQCYLFISKIAFVLLLIPHENWMASNDTMVVVVINVTYSRLDLSNGSCDKRWVINNDISEDLMSFICRC